MFFHTLKQFCKEEKHFAELNPPGSHLSSPSSFCRLLLYWKSWRFSAFSSFEIFPLCPTDHQAKAIIASEPSVLFCHLFWWWLTPLFSAMADLSHLGWLQRASAPLKKQETCLPCGNKFSSPNWVLKRHHMFGGGPWRPSAWHPNKSFRVQPQFRLLKKAQLCENRHGLTQLLFSLERSQNTNPNFWWSV